MVPSTAPSSSPSECVDEIGWIVNKNTVSEFGGMSCEELGTSHTSEANAQDWCNAVASYPDHVFAGKSVKEACCKCGGSEFKTRFPSSLPSFRPSISETPTVISEIPSSEPSSQPSVCRDEPDWFFEHNGATLTCDHIADNPDDYCTRFENIYTRDKNTHLACCDCGGGVHQSVSPSSIPTDSPSSNPSASPSLSFKPTVAVSEHPSQSPSLSMEPSIFPSTEPNKLSEGEPCNYDVECRDAMICNEGDEGKTCGPSSKLQVSDKSLF